MRGLGLNYCSLALLAGVFTRGKWELHRVWLVTSFIASVLFSRSPATVWAPRTRALFRAGSVRGLRFRNRTRTTRKSATSAPRSVPGSARPTSASFTRPRGLRHRAGAPFRKTDPTEIKNKIFFQKKFERLEPVREPIL